MHFTFRRLISCVLALTFIADPLWAEGASTFLRQLSSPSSALKIPSEYGRITDFYNGSNEARVISTNPPSPPLSKGGEGGFSSSPMAHRSLVVLIQDLHANVGVQRNIAKILKHLSRHGSCVMRRAPRSVDSGHTTHDSRHRVGSRHLTVFVEGATGQFDFSPFFRIPDKRIRKKAAEFFLKGAKLTGAEYAAALNDPQIRLWGVDDKGLYLSNLEAFYKASSPPSRTVIASGAKQSRVVTTRDRHAALAMTVGSWSPVPHPKHPAWKEYYAIAKERDIPLALNSLAQLDLLGNTYAPPSAVALVAGGYHTEGIAQILKANGVPYVVVTPRVERIDHEDLYRERLRSTYGAATQDTLAAALLWAGSTYNARGHEFALVALGGLVSLAGSSVLQSVLREFKTTPVPSPGLSSWPNTPHASGLWILAAKLWGWLFKTPEQETLRFIIRWVAPTAEALAGGLTLHFWTLDRFGAGGSFLATFALPLAVVSLVFALMHAWAFDKSDGKIVVRTLWSDSKFVLKTMVVKGFYALLFWGLVYDMALPEGWLERAAALLAISFAQLFIDQVFVMSERPLAQILREKSAALYRWVAPARWRRQEPWTPHFDSDEIFPLSSVSAKDPEVPKRMREVLRKFLEPSADDPHPRAVEIFRDQLACVQGLSHRALKKHLEIILDTRKEGKYDVFMRDLILPVLYGAYSGTHPSIGQLFMDAEQGGAGAAVDSSEDSPQKRAQDVFQSAAREMLVVARALDEGVVGKDQVEHLLAESLRHRRLEEVAHRWFKEHPYGYYGILDVNRLWDLNNFYVRRKWVDRLLATLAADFENAVENLGGHVQRIGGDEIAFVLPADYNPSEVEGKLLALRKQLQDCLCARVQSAEESSGESDWLDKVPHLFSKMRRATLQPPAPTVSIGCVKREWVEMNPLRPFFRRDGFLQRIFHRAEDAAKAAKSERASGVYVGLAPPHEHRAAGGPSVLKWGARLALLFITLIDSASALLHPWRGPHDHFTFVHHAQQFHRDIGGHLQNDENEGTLIALKFRYGGEAFVEVVDPRNGDQPDHGFKAVNTVYGLAGGNKAIRWILWNARQSAYRCFGQASLSRAPPDSALIFVPRRVLEHEVESYLIDFTTALRQGLSEGFEISRVQASVVSSHDRDMLWKMREARLKALEARLKALEDTEDDTAMLHIETEALYAQLDSLRDRMMTRKVRQHPGRLLELLDWVGSSETPAIAVREVPRLSGVQIRRYSPADWAMATRLVRERQRVRREKSIAAAQTLSEASKVARVMTVDDREDRISALVNEVTAALAAESREQLTDLLGPEAPTVERIAKRYRRRPHRDFLVTRLVRHVITEGIRRSEAPLVTLRVGDHGLSQVLGGQQSIFVALSVDEESLTVPEVYVAVERSLRRRYPELRRFGPLRFDLPHSSAESRLSDGDVLEVRADLNDWRDLSNERLYLKNYRAVLDQIIAPLRQGYWTSKVYDPRLNVYQWIDDAVKEVEGLSADQLRDRALHVVGSGTHPSFKQWIGHLADGIIGYIHSRELFEEDGEGNYRGYLRTAMTLARAYAEGALTEGDIQKAHRRRQQQTQRVAQTLQPAWAGDSLVAGVLLAVVGFIAILWKHGSGLPSLLGLDFTTAVVLGTALFLAQALSLWMGESAMGKEDPIFSVVYKNRRLIEHPWLRQQSEWVRRAFRALYVVTRWTHERAHQVFLRLLFPLDQFLISRLPLGFAAVYLMHESLAYGAQWFIFLTVVYGFSYWYPPAWVAGLILGCMVIGGATASVSTVLLKKVQAREGLIPRVSHAPLPAMWRVLALVAMVMVAMVSGVLSEMRQRGSVAWSVRAVVPTLRKTLLERTSKSLSKEVRELLQREINTVGSDLIRGRLNRLFGQGSRLESPFGPDQAFRRVSEEIQEETRMSEDRRQVIEDALVTATQKFNLPYMLVVAMIAQETDFKPAAGGGLLQIQPGEAWMAAQQLKEDPDFLGYLRGVEKPFPTSTQEAFDLAQTDTVVNLYFALRHIANLYHQTGDPSEAALLNTFQAQKSVKETGLTEEMFASWQRLSPEDRAAFTAALYNAGGAYRVVHRRSTQEAPATWAEARNDYQEPTRGYGDQVLVFLRIGQLLMNQRERLDLPAALSITQKARGGSPLLIPENIVLGASLSAISGLIAWKISGGFVSLDWNSWLLGIAITVFLHELGHGPPVRLAKQNGQWKVKANWKIQSGAIQTEQRWRNGGWGTIVSGPLPGLILGTGLLTVSWLANLPPDIGHWTLDFGLPFLAINLLALLPWQAIRAKMPAFFQKFMSPIPSDGDLLGPHTSGGLIRWLLAMASGLVVARYAESLWIGVLFALLVAAGIPTFHTRLDVEERWGKRWVDPLVRLVVTLLVTLSVFNLSKVMWDPYVGFSEVGVLVIPAAFSLVVGLLAQGILLKRMNALMAWRGRRGLRWLPPALVWLAVVAAFLGTLWTIASFGPRAFYPVLKGPLTIVLRKGDKDQVNQALKPYTTAMAPLGSMNVTVSDRPFQRNHGLSRFLGRWGFGNHVIVGDPVWLGHEGGHGLFSGLSKSRWSGKPAEGIPTRPQDTDPAENFATAFSTYGWDAGTFLDLWAEGMRDEDAYLMARHFVQEKGQFLPLTQSSRRARLPIYRSGQVVREVPVEVDGAALKGVNLREALTAVVQGVDVGSMRSIEEIRKSFLKDVNRLGWKLTARFLVTDPHRLADVLDRVGSALKQLPQPYRKPMFLIVTENRRPSGESTLLISFDGIRVRTAPQGNLTQACIKALTQSVPYYGVQSGSATRQLNRMKADMMPYQKRLGSSEELLRLAQWKISGVERVFMEARSRGIIRPEEKSQVERLLRELAGVVDQLKKRYGQTSDGTGRLLIAENIFLGAFLAVVPILFEWLQAGHTDIADGGPLALGTVLAVVLHELGHGTPPWRWDWQEIKSSFVIRQKGGEQPSLLKLLAGPLPGLIGGILTIIWLAHQPSTSLRDGLLPFVLPFVTINLLALLPWEWLRGRKSDIDLLLEQGLHRKADPLIGFSLFLILLDFAIKIPSRLLLPLALMVKGLRMPGLTEPTFEAAHPVIHWIWSGQFGIWHSEHLEISRAGPLLLVFVMGLSFFLADKRFRERFKIAGGLMLAGLAGNCLEIIAFGSASNPFWIARSFSTNLADVYLCLGGIWVAAQIYLGIFRDLIGQGRGGGRDGGSGVGDPGSAGGNDPPSRGDDRNLFDRCDLLRRAA